MKFENAYIQVVKYNKVLPKEILSTVEIEKPEVYEIDGDYLIIETHMVLPLEEIKEKRLELLLDATTVIKCKYVDCYTRSFGTKFLLKFSFTENV